MLTLPDAIVLFPAVLSVGGVLFVGVLRYIPSKAHVCPNEVCSEHKHFAETIVSLKQSVEVSNRAIYGKLDTVSNELARLCGYIEGKENRNDDAS
jgi:hypothetical protein